MANVSKFSVTLELGATFKTGDEAWTKPGVATSITFDGIPDQDVLNTALRFMEREILEPVLADVAQTAVEYTKKANNQ